MVLYYNKGGETKGQKPETVKEYGELFLNKETSQNCSLCHTFAQIAGYH